MSESNPNRENGSPDPSPVNGPVNPNAESVRPKKRKRDFARMERAHGTEDDNILRMVYLLSLALPDRVQTTGRPGMSLRDLIIALALVVLEHKSLRRVRAKMRRAKRKGFMSRVPNFRTLSRYFKSPLVSLAVQGLIEKSAEPLVKLEGKTAMELAFDGTGVSTSVHSTWYSLKAIKWLKAHPPRPDDSPERRARRERAEKALKRRKIFLHATILASPNTHIIAAADVLFGVHESKMLPGELRVAGRRFPIGTLYADRGVISLGNLRALDEFESGPVEAVIPFRKKDKERGFEVWDSALARFKADPPRFWKKYGKRNQVETVFSMANARCGDKVRAQKLGTAISLTMMKFLVHNLARLNYYFKMRELKKLLVRKTKWDLVELKDFVAQPPQTKGQKAPYADHNEYLTDLAEKRRLRRLRNRPEAA